MWIKQAIGVLDDRKAASTGKGVVTASVREGRRSARSIAQTESGNNGALARSTEKGLHEQSTKRDPTIGTARSVSLTYADGR